MDLVDECALLQLCLGDVVEQLCVLSGDAREMFSAVDVRPMGSLAFSLRYGIK